MSDTSTIDGSVIWSRLLDFVTLEHAFALDAMLASLVVGVVCGVVGTFLVLRGLSLLGDAVGHATLPGVCAAFLLTGGKAAVALLAGALASGVAAAAAVAGISSGRRTRPDAAIGIVLTAFFGLGIILLTAAQDSPTGAQAGLDTYLFGNAAGIDRAQLIRLAILGSFVLAGVIISWRPLAISTFDEEFARSVGIPVRGVNVGLMVALAIAVVVSIEAVGVVLVAAMLIIPPTTAFYLSARLPVVASLSAGIGGLSGIFGATLSYLFEGVATGPAMVLFAGTFFVLAATFGPFGGGLVEWMRRRRQLREVAA